MSDRDERLNGLLDGELSPAEASDIAHTLRDDPVLMARFADLARVRAVTSGIDAALPAPDLPAGAAPVAWQRPGWLAGGALLGLAAVALLAILPADEAPALAAHRRFLTSAIGEMEIASSVPNLSAVGLRLARVEPAGTGLYAGYVGPRGCRLGLWLGTRGEAPAGTPAGWQSKTVQENGNRVVWIAASPGMDTVRFTALAEMVQSGPAASAARFADASSYAACLS